jgi:hypothetical protein
LWPSQFENEVDFSTIENNKKNYNNDSYGGIDENIIDDSIDENEEVDSNDVES